jgi:type III secretion system YscD/HrpQ family protein
LLLPLESNEVIFMKPATEDKLAKSAHKQSGAVALAVMGGLHDGATIDLPDQPICLVGRAPHCDIILRDESVAAEHIAIVRDKEGVHVRALAAGFGYEEKVIAPGDSIIIASNPSGASVRLGSIEICIRQPEPKLTASASNASPDEATATSATSDATVGSAVAPKERRHFRTTLAFSLFGVGSVLTFAAFALSMSDGLLHKSAERLASVRNAIDNIPQLAGVKVIEEQGSKIALTGFVANDEERNLLNSRLKPGTFDSMRVHVGSDLATRAKDLLRVNGYTAVTSYEPQGKIRAALNGVDKETQDRLADTIRKDLPMISAVQMTSSATAAELARAAGPTCVNPDADRDALKFVASFAGDYAFVRAANGVKYFVGSRLPTGHEISEIRESEIVLNCVGKFTTVAL